MMKAYAESFNHDKLNHMPTVVEQSICFLDHSNIWYVLSTNSVATSCKDAAARRHRIGLRGIPLYDELKSLCFVLYKNNTRMHCVLHSRANSRVNESKAAKLLGASKPLARLCAQELTQEFGAMYGTVNPFYQPEKFIHIFDEDVLNHYTAPHTMMTNAGDHQWAIEFKPQELINALKTVTQVIIAPITNQTEKPKPLPTIGIITGNGPESGMSLWRYINDEVRQQLTAEKRMHGDLSYPKILVHSLPEMGLSMELAQREDMVWEVIAEALAQMCKNNVTHIALACNTTPYFSDKIREFCKPHDVEFISIAEATEQYIAANQLDNITIIGIPIVADLGSYSSYQSLRHLNIQSAHQRVYDDLQEFGYLVKRLGDREQDSKAMNKLQHIINVGVQTPKVLIALTEISVFLQRFPKFRGKIRNREIIDPLPIYAKSLANIYLSALPSEKAVEDDE